MAQFVLLTSLTAQGRETLHATPERVLGVNEEMDRFGCKVVSQYALLGEYDFLTIIEAPDSVTVAHLSIDLGSRGTVAIRTLPAITVDELLEQLHSSHQLAAKPVVSPTAAGGQDTDRRDVRTDETSEASGLNRGSDETGEFPVPTQA